MKGVMNVLDRTGHTAVEWEANAVGTDVADGPVNPEYAAAEFDRLVAQGHLAFHTDGKGENVQFAKGERFDPSVHSKVTMVPAFQGG